MLTTLREGGFYEPLTDEEFAKFTAENPELAKYFLETETGEDVAPVSEIEVPPINEGALVFDHWEKVAARLMLNLQRNQNAYIFNQPVDPKALEIPDYFTVVKNPMDFGTIKTKLKESRYASLTAFCEDMTLVFDNCKLYNGEASAVG